MIKIESKKNKFTYNVYHVTKAFYPKEDIVQTVDEKQEPLVKIHLPEGTCFSLAPEECVQTEDVQEEILGRIRPYLGEEARIKVELVDEIPVLASGKRKYIENRCEKYKNQTGFCG